MSSRFRRAVLVAGPLSLLVLGFALFGQTGRDDSYISYWPALTLAERGEILNYNLERVEQSSTLLWVLVLAALRWLSGGDLPALGLAGSLVAAVACLTVLALGRSAGREGGAVACLLVATQPFFLYWAWSGAETALAALVLLALAVSWAALLSAPTLRPGLLGGALASTLALVLVRPEGALVAMAAVVTLSGSWRGQRQRRGRLALLGAGSAVTWASVLGFRLLYFGALQPQPVAAKVGTLSWATWTRGWRYLERALMETPALSPVLALALAALVIQLLKTRQAEDDPRSSLLCVAASLALAQLGFVVAVGGDWMENGRFLAPMVPLLAVVLVATLERWLPSPLRFRLAVLILIVLQLIATVGVARRSSTGTDLLTRRELPPALAQSLEAQGLSPAERGNLLRWRDVQALEQLHRLLDRLLPALERPVSILSGQMGMVAYHTARRHPGAVRFVDRYGLVSRDLTDCPVTRHVPRGPLGLLLTPARFHSLQQELEARCGLAPPDVIFDLFAERGSLRYLERAGYFVTFEQRGRVPPALDGFRRQAFRAEQFIAVRRDLAERLGLSETVRREIGPPSSGEPEEGRVLP
ncbi:MAG TPA: hypothetical protein VF017_04280 [Thermoanaerobaculia bacterium]|nr:hypothetical protein [Thermoanaerobaculia bacterium]